MNELYSEKPFEFQIGEITNQRDISRFCAKVQEVLSRAKRDQIIATYQLGVKFPDKSWFEYAGKSNRLPDPKGGDSMKPQNFPEANVRIAEHQEEYLTLPAFVSQQGETTFVWKLTWRERLRLLFTGLLWHSVLTFGRPLQPQLLQTIKPFDLLPDPKGGDV